MFLKFSETSHACLAYSEWRPKPMKIMELNQLKETKGAMTICDTCNKAPKGDQELRLQRLIHPLPRLRAATLRASPTTVAARLHARQRLHALHAVAWRAPPSPTATPTDACNWSLVLAHCSPWMRERDGSRRRHSRWVPSG